MWSLGMITGNEWQHAAGAGTAYSQNRRNTEYGTCMGVPLWECRLLSGF
jgi:hypothetical protein